MMSTFAFSQMASFIHPNPSSFLWTCDTATFSVSPVGVDYSSVEDINLYFTGTSILNEQYSLVVDWGDNVTTTHTGLSVNPNEAILWTPALSHIYPIDSVYTVTFTLEMVSTGQTLGKTIYGLSTQSCSQYMLSIANDLDCNSNGVTDGTVYSVGNVYGVGGYIIPGSSFYLFNNLDTIYGLDVFTGYSMVSFPTSTPNGNYSLGIKQSVLDSLDLTWVSTTPSTPISIPGSYVAPNAISNLFTCNPDSVCINGFAFCDDNSNGIMDNNEAIIPNLPLNMNNYIHYSGTVNQADSTDVTGYYNFPITIYDSAQFTLIVDQAWLNANGYVANNTIFNFNFPSYNNSDSLFDCATHFNIPIICNASSSDSICVGGQLFCDVNNNGILDGNETVIPNAPVNITLLNGAGSFTTFSDSLGNYIYHNYHPNTDSVEVEIPSYWLVNHGYSAMAPTLVTTLDCSIATDLAVDCNISLPCDNTWINLFGAGPYYQNWTNTMALTFGNSNYIFPGSVYTISITIPNGSTLDTSALNVANYTLNGNILTWTQTINGFDSLLIDFNVAAGIADSTLHNYTAAISGPNLDCDSTNNLVSYTAIVGSSYDPNNKLVNLPPYINAGMQEELIYTINFQNTGTAPAQDVRIEDQLSQYLDWSSLEVVSKSHNMFYALDANGKITFTFPQIWLPDSTTNEPLSKGYVSFKIKENINVPLNVPIENTASIYFDLNPPIITNTTSNTNSVLSNGSIAQSTTLKIYPNPSNGLFHIVSNEMINEVRVFDLSGKQVFYRNDSNNHTQIDLSNLNKGMYVVKITSAGTITNRRIILN